jgi:hypothetical protein
MEDCSICYEGITEATGHCTLSCKHSFHICCLTRWSSENPNCPLCRNPLSAKETPSKTVRVIEDQDEFMMWVAAYRPHTQDAVNIGDNIRVGEEDIATVMLHGRATRGEAVRALRRYEGDIVESVLMLTNPDPVRPRRSRERDPARTSSDDQATAWFIQRMFGDDTPFYNTYCDLLGRMNYTLRRNRNWQHQEHEDLIDNPGYESA